MSQLELACIRHHDVHTPQLLDSRGNELLHLYGAQQQMPDSERVPLAYSVNDSMLGSTPTPAELDGAVHAASR
jgi:hypothetical protein